MNLNFSFSLISAVISIAAFVLTLNWFVFAVMIYFCLHLGTRITQFIYKDCDIIHKKSGYLYKIHTLALRKENLVFGKYTSTFSVVDENGDLKFIESDQFRISERGIKPISKEEEKNEIDDLNKLWKRS